MLSEVGYLTAFGGGMLSFLSPCVLPLVPPYLGFMAGSSISDLSNREVAVAQGLRARAITSSALFVLGFSVVFISLGMTATALGKLVNAYSDVLTTIGGIIIIAMGLHFLGLFKIGILQQEARFRSTGTGYVGAFVMGLAFAFGWTPCIGPILGAIFGIAASKSTVAEGGALLAVYSAGLGVPFLLAAIFIEPFMSFLQRFKAHLGTVEKVMGAVLVLTGVAFLTGFMQWFSYKLIEWFPFFALVG